MVGFNRTLDNTSNTQQSSKASMPLVLCRYIEKVIGEYQGMNNPFAFVSNLDSSIVYRYTYWGLRWYVCGSLLGAKGEIFAENLRIQFYP